MSKPIASGKISMHRVEEKHFYRNEKGETLDFAIWENKNGADQYGNTHYITQSVSKEARVRGEKGPIIGNCKVL